MQDRDVVTVKPGLQLANPVEPDHRRPVDSYEAAGIEPAGLAGPLWAEAGTEVYEPWMRWYAMGGMVPFDQAHGHSSLVHYPDRSWRCPGRVRERAQVDWGARLVRTRIGGRVFHAVDPKHGKSGADRWQPLILDDARLVQTAAA